MPVRLLLLLLLLLPCLAGCQRWGTRMDRLRDDRVGEIETSLGMSGSLEAAPSPRARAMPELDETSAR